MNLNHCNFKIEHFTLLYIMFFLYIYMRISIFLRVLEIINFEKKLEQKYVICFEKLNF